MSGKVQKFLRLYNSENTVKSYRLGLKHFFKTIYDLEELPKNRSLEAYADRYFSAERDYEADLQQLVSIIGDSPPKTIRLYMASVKMFLLENSVELSQRFWRRLRGRVKGSRARTIDRVPSNRELRQILMHLPFHGRALFLMLSSSGLRIGEALQLTMDDIELGRNPAKITVRGETTKTGNPRVSFASTETVELLKQWIPQRQDYLQSAVGKSHIYDKELDDLRFFPFSESTAGTMWRNALRKAGLDSRDKSTNRYKLHIHVLRKFYRLKLRSVIPVDVVEALMGHEGYLTEVYRRYSVVDLAKFYKQGEQVLQVFGSDIEEISKMRDELKQDRDNLQRIVNGLTAENLELKSRISKVELEVTEIKNIMDKLI